MKCPYCGNLEDKVVDSRSSAEGNSIRRRRECLKCERRFTTYERIEETPLMVVKKDGRREVFERKKILSGLVKACEKRPVSMENLEQLVDKIEFMLQKTYEKEVQSKEIGELVIKLLQQLDEVAYVRFASVYRQFKDVAQFMKELKGLLPKEEK
ncbi:MAG: transcriptional regulator NrdR [Omnitrophica bacterium]|nr:transcriptional regulator NrdR [Candidatus Omnitrophota bacterium]